MKQKMQRRTTGKMSRIGTCPPECHLNVPLATTKKLKLFPAAGAVGLAPDGNILRRRTTGKCRVSVPVGKSSIERATGDKNRSFSSSSCRRKRTLDFRRRKDNHVGAILSTDHHLRKTVQVQCLAIDSEFGPSCQWTATREAAQDSQVAPNWFIGLFVNDLVAAMACKKHCAIGTLNRAETIGCQFHCGRVSIVFRNKQLATQLIGKVSRLPLENSVGRRADFCNRSRELSIRRFFARSEFALSCVIVQLRPQPIRMSIVVTLENDIHFVWKVGVVRIRGTRG
jgi:hypothetical protein